MPDFKKDRWTGKPMAKNYVLVDFENVQPKDLHLLQNEDIEVLIFVGAGQKNIPLSLVKSIQELGHRAHYIESGGAGKNALDFHLAYYLGVLNMQVPEAYVHIISKDTGFDPLIRHLQGLQKKIKRHGAIEDIPIITNGLKKNQVVLDSPQPKPQSNKPRTTAQRAALIRTNFVARKNGNCRPASLATLRSTACHVLGETLDDAAFARLLQSLQTSGYLIVIDQKVSYPVD